MAGNPPGLILSSNTGRTVPGPVVQIPVYAVWVYPHETPGVHSGFGGRQYHVLFGALKEQILLFWPPPPPESRTKTKK